MTLSTFLPNHSILFSDYQIDLATDHGVCFDSWPCGHLLEVLPHLDVCSPGEVAEAFGAAASSTNTKETFEPGTFSR